MENSLQKILQGYQQFRKKYASGDNSVMQFLSHYGQQPKLWWCHVASRGQACEIAISF